LTGGSADVGGAPLVYGIDIGDWNCVIAVGRQRSTFDLVAARVIPAAVAVAEDGTHLAGWPAYQEARHEFDRYRRGLNRVFGQDDRIWLGERPVDTGHLMSLLLRELRTAAEAAVRGTPDRVAIAVPDGWGDARRAGILAAAEAAGFDAQRLVVVDRPVVAAAHAAERMSGDRKLHLLVYDLGGTSFACTLVRRTAAGLLVAVGQTATRAGIGAAAFDQELVAAMAARSPQVKELLDAPDPDEDQRHRIAGLQSLAEDLKVRLGSAPRVRTYVTLVQPGFAFEVDRGAFDEATRLSVRATVVTCEGLLSRHEMSWADVDAIVLAGGGANLPAVRRELAAASGHTVEVPHEPELLVARGAAHQAGRDIQAVRDEQRAAASDDSVPVTGKLAVPAPSGGMFAAALAAWLGWAGSAGLYTGAQWRGVVAWLALGAGALIPLLMAYGYVTRRYAAPVVAVGLGVGLGLLHVVTLGIYGYRESFTSADVGWIPFVALGVGVLALVGFVAAVSDLDWSFSQAHDVKVWEAGRRAMVRRVLRDKEIGKSQLPSVARRLVGEFPAARGFKPADGPFDFAIVSGRTLLLGSTRAGAMLSADQINSAVAAYLGRPGSAPTHSSVIAQRFAGRPINVHCFVIADADPATAMLQDRASPDLRQAGAARSGSGEPAMSTSLAVVDADDLEARLRRLLERADSELYLPLLERAAEAAGVTS
jgi:hypothetical protein